MIQLCRHIFRDNRQCGQPAVNGTLFCRHHRDVKGASSLLSANTNRDPLNRPWSVAEYTFGDAIRRHEAQYAARAAAALAAGIEPPPYEPFTTGMIPPGHPDYEEAQQMQQHSSEYWAAHFRKLIAERGPHGSAPETDSGDHQMEAGS